MDLRIPAATLNELNSLLLSCSPEEAGAFLLIEPSAGDLTLRTVDVFRADELDHVSGGIALRDEAKVARLVDAKRRGHAIVDVHTHPVSSGRVRFSKFDLEELSGFARYVQFKIPGLPFGALVLGRENYQGLVWNSDRPEPLTLQVIGEALSVRPWLPAEDDPMEPAEWAMYDRQILALGPTAQRRIAGLRVAVIGRGGTGSVAVQLLAHLGVRDFVLIDDDLVEASNLSRLAGATRRDAEAGRSKTHVARRLIRSLARRARIISPGTLRSTGALRLLHNVDLVVGCVDNDGGRLILAELAASRLLPYLDIGVSVEATTDGGILLGGRVSFYIPGGPCLACADEIDFGEAAEDLEDESLRALRRQRGYARNRGVEPALMPLNTAVAGEAMVELLAFIGGFRQVERFFRYEASGQRIVRQNVRRQELCPLCGPAEGMGDRHQIERYALTRFDTGQANPPD